MLLSRIVRNHKQLMHKSQVLPTQLCIYDSAHFLLLVLRLIIFQTIPDRQLIREPTLNCMHRACLDTAHEITLNSHGCPQDRPQ